MSVDKFHIGLKLIKNAGLEMDMARPVNNSDIENCEKSLGYLLPSSYHEFLLKYGFGGVDAVEIYGLIRGDLESDTYVNAFSFTQDLRKNHDLPRNLFAIQNYDGDAAVCLLLSLMNDGECPVILWDHSESHQKQVQKPYVLAESFGDYFHSQVSELIEALE